MEKDREDTYKKTQTSSSPGALGEETNRHKNEVQSANNKSAEKTSSQEGLNEERSQGTAGAFEGFGKYAERVSKWL